MEINKENIKKYLLGKLDEQSQKDFEKAIENKEDIKKIIQKAKIGSEIIDDFVEELAFLQNEKKQKEWEFLQAKLDKPQPKVISLASRKTLGIAASAVFLLTFIGIWIYVNNQKTAINLATNEKRAFITKDTTKGKNDKKPNIDSSEQKDSTKKKKDKKNTRKSLLFNKTDVIVENLNSILPKDELSTEVDNIGFASGNNYLDTLKLALQFYNSQNYVEAVKQFEVYEKYLVSQNDKDFEANYYLAFTYLQNKQYKKAQNLLEELYNLEGFLEDKKTWKPQILYALANLYLWEKQETKAKEILEEIVDKVHRKKIEEVLKLK